MERYEGYWISGTAVAGPPNTTYWESLGIILKDGRLGSIVEVGRIQDDGITFDLAGLAASEKRLDKRLRREGSHPGPGRR